MKPVIGVVTRIEEKPMFEQIELHQEYIDTIVKLGGDPLLIIKSTIFDNNEQKRVRAWLSKCNGIVITGGNKPTDLDYFVLEYAIDNNLPIFGICLGMQVMSTYNCENNLILIGNEDHRKVGSKYVHEVNLKEDSKLFKYLGYKKRIKVNSRHVEQVVNGGIFKIAALSDDGVVEAVENENHIFQIGVQWHPESMILYDENNFKLWEQFIKSCM